MARSSSFPLSMASEGARVRIVALAEGKGFRRRAIEMGLNIGTELIIRQPQGGGMVLARGEIRLALGGGMAHKIIVSLL